MGVGAQWKLRHGAAQPESGPVEEAVAPLAAVAAPVVAAPVMEAPVAQPVQSPAPVIAERVEPMLPVAVPQTPATPPPREPVVAEEAEAVGPEDDSTAWFDDAPAPARSAPVNDEAIAAMDWPALKAAVSTCTRCTLCETRRNAVNGRGAGDASWIAIVAAPSRLDEKDNQPVTGEAGLLLDNMLKAISLKPDADVYVTQLVKCRPSNPDGSDRAPTVDELTACRPFLDRELELSGATMAMTFGQFAAKGLMMGPAARGKVMRYGAAELPVVATYHPDDLLRKPEDKAKAWGDLCLAKAARD
jgi:DNA polymerase